MKGLNLSRGRYGDQESNHGPEGTHRDTHPSTHPATHHEKSRAHTGKSPRKTAHQRRIPDLSSNERLYERAYHLLKDHDPRLRLTVYRLNGDHRLKPAVLACQPFPMDALCDYLRDQLGGG